MKTFRFAVRPLEQSLPRAARFGLRLLLGGLPLLAACKQGNAPSRPEEDPVITRSVSLEINGYNYTDLYIDSFSVNGQGGGNLFVSSPETGGGGSVCCVGFTPGTRLPVPLTIRWTRDRERWCEKEVMLDGPVPANPRHLGVHFFPDGHIEVEITENDPEVKLPLERLDRGQRKASGNTVADEQTARCKDGY